MHCHTWEPLPHPSERQINHRMNRNGWVATARLITLIWSAIHKQFYHILLTNCFIEDKEKHLSNKKSSHIHNWVGAHNKGLCYSWVIQKVLRACVWYFIVMTQAHLCWVSEFLLHVMNEQNSNGWWAVGEILNTGLKISNRLTNSTNDRRTVNLRVNETYFKTVYDQEKEKIFLGARELTETVC